MRILTVTNLYPTDVDPTYGTFVGDQVKALRQHPKVETCDVMFVDGRRSRWNYARAFLQLRQAIRRSRPDVILAHYGLTGSVAVSQRQVPVVVTFHAGDLLGQRWQRSVSRLAYRLAGDAISVSIDGLHELPGPAHHVTCGIDLELFRPRDREHARSRFGLEPGELGLLFPSSPHRIYKMYPRFVSVRDELRGRGLKVHELQLRGLARTDVPQLMAAADVMVMTSSVEAAPVAVMEALACGLSVVSTPVADVPSMLEGVAGARVLPFETQAFADAVEELAAAPPGPRQPDAASRRFDERVVTEEIVTILERACDRRRGRRGTVTAL